MQDIQLIACYGVGRRKPMRKPPNVHFVTLGHLRQVFFYPKIQSYGNI